MGHRGRAGRRAKRAPPPVGGEPPEIGVVRAAVACATGTPRSHLLAARDGLPLRMRPAPSGATFATGLPACSALTRQGVRSPRSAPWPQPFAGPDDSDPLLARVFSQRRASWLNVLLAYFLRRRLGPRSSAPPVRSASLPRLARRTASQTARTTPPSFSPLRFCPRAPRRRPTRQRLCHRRRLRPRARPGRPSWCSRRTERAPALRP